MGNEKELLFHCEHCGEKVFADYDYLINFPESSTVWYQQLERQHKSCSGERYHVFTCEHCGEEVWGDDWEYLHTFGLSYWRKQLEENHKYCDPNYSE